MKTLTQFITEIKAIQEELTPDQKKEVDAWPETSNRKIEFSDHVFGGPDNHRVTIPLETHQAEVPHEVKSHLEQHGMTVDNESYAKGHATDKYNRPVRIGAALEKTKAPDHVKQAFTSDPQRSLKDKNDKLQVVFTRHPHDVAGMTSQGHSWENQSCMNYSSGSRSRYIPKDVEQGTHIAYLTHKGDHEAKNPIARIALKPFHADYGSSSFPHTIVRPENRTYGAVNTAFENTVNNFTEKHFPAKADIYRKDRSVYDDTGNNIEVGNVSKALDSTDTSIRSMAIRKHNVKPEHIDKALNDQNPGVRSLAAAHPKATSAHITKALDDKFDRVRETAINNPNANIEHITKALDDADADVRSRAISHPKVNASHITKALDDQWLPVRYKAISNPNVTKEHLTKALDDADSRIRSAAIGHPKITAEHITKALNDPEDAIRGRAAIHDKAEPHHITQALNDSNKDIRLTAISNPKINASHITQALNDPDPAIRRTALQNRLVQPEHLTKALNMKGEKYVASRMVAAGHPDATSAHISKALTDENVAVRFNAAENEKATPDHVTKALGDEDAGVRWAAVKHKNATPTHVQQAMNDPDPTVKKAAAERSKEMKIKK